MILINELKGAIARKGYSQSNIAEKLGITPKTFYDKMKKGIFDSDELYSMIQILEIEDPARIFFAHNVTCEVTKSK